ncbi:putative Calcineurin-like phosphoesterase [Blattamonas nauphoetae]|uniref:protein-serine/threonine phosphatase n=1 Tax=Blattamonas nauphoetae TaxID=2049346 RepID=A0ABQ9YIK4_9EUKA|nr:putative Calcineurin-like phosphoesterase [Blattamonas nauphoetae]
MKETKWYCRSLLITSQQQEETSHDTLVSVPHPAEPDIPLNRDASNLQPVSTLQLFQPVLTHLIDVLDRKKQQVLNHTIPFPVSQITDPDLEKLGDVLIAGYFVLRELQPRSRLFAPAITREQFHSLDRIIKKLINTYPVLNVLTLHQLYLIWLRHNEEIAFDTNNQIWEENRQRVRESVNAWFRYCLVKLSEENREHFNLWLSPSLQMTTLQLLSDDPEVQRLDMNETTLRDYFIADVAAHLYTLLPFDITPTDIDGFIEEEEERAHAKPGSDLQCKEKGDNLRMKLMVLQMLAEYETRLSLFGMHLQPKFQTENFPNQNLPQHSPISENHNPCPLWDFESVQSLIQNQEEIHTAQGQLIRRLRRTMALLNLSPYGPILSSDGSENSSVSSLLVQTPTNPFTDNIITPDLLRWCVTRKAVWQNHTIMERHQPRHAHLVPCHSHCHPVAKIVASGFPIYATFHHHDRYIPSLTHNRDCQEMNLPVEPRPLVLSGKTQVLTQTYFLCSSPTSLTNGISTIFDPRRFVSFPSHIHGGAKWLLNFGLLRSEDSRYVSLPGTPEAVQAMTPDDLHAIRMQLQLLSNGFSPGRLYELGRLRIDKNQQYNPTDLGYLLYRDGHIILESMEYIQFGATMMFLNGSTFSRFLLLAQQHFGFYDWGYCKRPGTTDGEYRGVEEITLECGDVTQLHQPSDVVGQESVRGLFVVGDIHGNLNAALCCCDVIDVIVKQPPGQAAIVFCGDYIDRGPYSVEVLVILLLYRMRYPQHVFLVHGNHESSMLNHPYSQTQNGVSVTSTWDGLFNKMFPTREHGEHPFTRLLLDLFKAMPSAVLCTLRHTSIQNETPTVESRRVLCLHGGLSSIFPIPNLQQIINHPTIMDDSYAPSAEITQKFLAHWNRRTEHYSFHFSASNTDPSAADEPWQKRPRFSPITTRAFMAANRIDLILRGHEYPMNSEGTTESHDGAIITSFGTFDYSPSTYLYHKYQVPVELGRIVDPQMFWMDDNYRASSWNGAMQWLSLKRLGTTDPDPLSLIVKAKKEAEELHQSLRQNQQLTERISSDTFERQINNPTASFTFTSTHARAQNDIHPVLSNADGGMNSEPDAITSSAIVFTMKTIHFDSIVKMLSQK